jgi:rubredoxin
MSAESEAGTAFKQWMCDEEAGSPEEGIAAGTRWADVPPNWTCPECGARKEDFEMVEI